ncbi:flagellar hook-length control protein FliK, partial [Janthinobacterium sp.]|uniref:flagellar hook-length control protein FliK n=1 Tax=Janthinobacterium sp. TaxID=1871054 RepID=UPI00293D366B
PRAAAPAPAPASGDDSAAAFSLGREARAALPPSAMPADAERPAVIAAAPAASWGVSLPAGNANGAVPADTIKLSGPAPQWQDSLKDALGERLQVQLSRNSEHAVIRLDPPMLGRIEISIRHSAGALQINLSASNSEVLRQLHGVGDSMRQDLSQRQFGEVAVTVTATPRSAAAQAFAEGQGEGRGRQGGRPRDEAEPGRALYEADAPSSTFAMHERE